MVKCTAFAKGYRVTPKRETVFHHFEKGRLSLDVLKRGRPLVSWLKGVVPNEIVLDAKRGAIKQGHCRSATRKLRPPS
jgi:hypothetical protein